MENEVLELLKSSKRQNNMVGILPGSDIGNTIIEALEEVQQYRKHGVTVESALNNMCDLTAAEDLIEEYRAIGTPEECRAAMEKQSAKKVISFDYNNGTVNYGCPVCKRKIISKIDGKWCGGTFNEYCDRCGQKLDWRNEE